MRDLIYVVLIIVIIIAIGLEPDPGDDDPYPPPITRRPKRTRPPTITVDPGMAPTLPLPTNVNDPIWKPTLTPTPIVVNLPVVIND